jgi:hypothetical protein
MSRHRSKGKRFLSDLVRSERDKVASLKEVVNASTRGGKRARDGRDKHDASGLELDDAASSLLSVPSLLREFLARLPASFSGSVIDVDVVIRQLRNTVLPPKPSMEDSENASITNVTKKLKTSGTYDANCSV